MKFNLNETKKFMLREYFILNETNTLTEASAAEVALKWTTNFKNTLENTKNVLNKYITFAGISKNSATTKNSFNKIKNSIDKAWSDLELLLSMPEKDRDDGLIELKTDLEQYIKALELIKSEIKDEKSEYKILELTARLKKLSTLNSKDSWDKKDFAALIDHNEWINNTIIPLLNTADIDKSEEEVKNFKEVCETCLKLIKIIEDRLPEDFNSFDDETLKDYISIMKTSSENTTIKSADKINKGLIIANLDKYSKQVNILAQNYRKISHSKLLIANSVNISKQKEDKIAKEREEWETEVTSRGARWEEIYNACRASKNGKEATDKFWNGGLPSNHTAENPYNFPVVSEEESKGYFIKEWGAQADFIKSLTPFVSEVLSLGWTLFDNPFISYLKQTSKAPLTKEAYIYIHNAFIDKYISKKDLWGQGKLKKANLIFQPGFQKIKLDGLEYLQQQKIVINNQNKISENSTLEQLPIILFNIFDIKGNKRQPLAKVQDSTITELRPVSEIENIVETFVEDDTAEAKVKASDNDVTDIINEFTNVDKAKDALYYLTLEYRNSEVFKKLESSLQQTLKQNIESIKLSFDDYAELDKTFNNKLKFTNDQISSLFTNLAKQAKFVEK